MQNRCARKLWDGAVLVLGCGLYAVSFNWFFRGSGFVMGGFTGIAQIGNRLIPALPVGTTVFGLNLPLIVLFAKKEGIGKLWVTVLTITLSSALIDFVAANVQFQPVQTLSAILCGGVLMGLSLGLLLRRNATTGGTELAARLLMYRFPHLSIGKICLMIDISIIAAYALVFRELDNAVYGAIAMAIASRMIDLVVYGSVNAKLAIIVSGHCRRITEELLQLQLGVTVLQGKGAYTDSPRDILLCVFKHTRLGAIKQAALKVDPDVFFILCDAREVLGQGFTLPEKM